MKKYFVVISLVAVLWFLFTAYVSDRFPDITKHGLVTAVENNSEKFRDLSQRYDFDKSPILNSDDVIKYGLLSQYIKDGRLKVEKLDGSFVILISISEDTNWRFDPFKECWIFSDIIFSSSTQCDK